MRKIPDFYTVYLYCRVIDGFANYQKLSGGHISRAAAENYIHEYILNADGRIPRTEFCIQLYATGPAPAIIEIQQGGLSVAI